MGTDCSKMVLALVKLHANHTDLLRSNPSSVPRKYPLTNQAGRLH